MGSISFENLLPNEGPSPELKSRVAKWLSERAITVHDREDYLLFQMDFSYIAIFFCRIRLSGNTINCLSLHSYILGRFAAGFIGNEDLAELNRRDLLGRVVKNANLNLFCNCSGSHKGTKPALVQVPEYHMGAALFNK